MSIQYCYPDHRLSFKFLRKDNFHTFLYITDALDDFEKPQPKKKNRAIQYAEKEEKGKANLNNDPLVGNFLNEDALLKMATDFNGVLEQMAKEDPAMMAEFEKFQEKSGRTKSFNIFYSIL